MEINITTSAILFPAISYLFLACALDMPIRILVVGLCYLGYQFLGTHLNLISLTVFTPLTDMKNDRIELVNK